jgi:hypothetical protein
VNVITYVQQSNTTACRSLHGTSAIFLPNIHCSHVRPNSHVCKDACTAQCSNCDPNAQCVATYPTIESVVYQCQCKNGYVGNGTSCTAKQCVNDNCPAMDGTFECSTGLCKCTETFTHEPQPNQNNLCYCPTDSGSEIFYNNSVPICVPKGRCINKQYQCTTQSYNHVKCVKLDNDFTLFGACLCNYGFNGGWEFPCSCPSGKRIVWSEILDGQVCLSPDECTANRQCPKNSVCVIPSGTPIGHCSSRKRSIRNYD